MAAQVECIVEVAAQERAARRLRLSSAERALESLKSNGCVLLRGVFSVGEVDNLRAEFDSQWGEIDADQMLMNSRRPAPNPVLCVGEGRYETLLRMKGAFCDANLFANDLLCSFLARVLDVGFQLSGFTGVVSYPGAKLQHIHADFRALFNDPGLCASLPNYAITVAMPLVDVDVLTGPTAIWVGSHQWESSRTPRMEHATIMSLLRGDCVLIDYRTVHAGLPNDSRVARPILYMVYSRSWFFDEVNHRLRPSLDMAISDFETLPACIQPLVVRAFSQRVRAYYILASDKRSDEIVEELGS